MSKNRADRVNRSGYRLRELTDQAGLSVVDLLDEAAQGRLVLCMNIASGHGVEGKDIDIDEGERDFHGIRPVHLSGFYALFPRDAHQLFSSGRAVVDSVAPATRSLEGARYYRINWIQIPEGGGADTVVVTADDVWVTDAEWRRWLENRATGPDVGSEESVDSNEGKRERDNLLATIGWLSILIAAQRGNKYGSAQKPNAFQIAKAVVTQIEGAQARNQAEASKGMSETSLRGRISDGLKLLKRRSVVVTPEESAPD